MSEHGRDERLERAIDAALRQMVGGDGPADLHRRVLARLDEPPRRAPVRLGALVAAAVIVLALATVVWRRERPVPAPVVATARRPPVGLPVAPSAPAASPSPASAIRPRPPLPPVMPAPLEAEPGAGEIEPIEVTPLAVMPMDTPRWAIAPLRIEPMEIEPLADSQPEQP